MQSRHYTLSEMTCRCGRAACDALKEPPQEIIDRLDEFRDRLGVPLTVDSWIRCAYWNEQEGGELDPPSGHLDGTEVDLKLILPPEAPVSSYGLSLMLDAIFGGGPSITAPRFPSDRWRLFPRLGVGSNFLHVGMSDRLPSPRVWSYFVGTRRAQIISTTRRSA